MTSRHGPLTFELQCAIRSLLLTGKVVEDVDRAALTVAQTVGKYALVEFIIS